jgi:hypothetical protein
VNEIGRRRKGPAWRRPPPRCEHRARRARPEELGHALERSADDIKVVVQFAAV